jgi:hypothetical protein
VQEGPASLASAEDYLDSLTVYFGKGRGKGRPHDSYPHRPLAEIIAELSNAGVTGEVNLPKDEKACRETVKALRERTSALKARFDELAASRTGTDELREGIVETLVRWATLGKTQG